MFQAHLVHFNDPIAQGRNYDNLNGVTRQIKKGAFIVVLGFFLTAIYAVFIEPYRIEVTHHRVAAPVSTALKVLQLADLHISHIGRIEKKAIAITREESPDLIVISGDLFDRLDSIAVVKEFLSSLSAPLGVWWINGNWENWTLQEIRAVASDPLIELKGQRLINQNVHLANGLWLVGFDDLLSGRPDPRAATNSMPKDAYCISLFHSPEYFSKAPPVCKLNLAGHTHGGQIRLPWIRPFWLPHGSGEYIEGWYEREGAKMYVSRGVGTSILPARLFSRPEIAVFTLEKEK